jgi:hypothetical protein
VESYQKAFARTEQIIAVLQTSRLWDTHIDGPDGEIPLLTEDQLEALLQLGAEAAMDLYAILEELLPDPLRWPERPSLEHSEAGLAACQGRGVWVSPLSIAYSTAAAAMRRSHQSCWGSLT